MGSTRVMSRRDLVLLSLAQSAAMLVPQRAAAAERRLKTAHLMDPELRAALSRPLQMPQRATKALDTEVRIPGPPGAPDVRILVYRPQNRSIPVPAVLYIHGGGYVAGSPEMYKDFGFNWENEVGCVVVSVGYRLAPGARFPNSLEDNYAALKWLHENAAKLNVDPRRIAVAGASAGGGHAAALAIAARDRGKLPIAFQMLIYPMLDDRTGSTVQASPSVGEVVWTAEQNRQGWAALLGVPAGSRDVPAGAVPARVADLSGLPPAYIGVGALDLFVEEDIDYARRLLRAGVPVELDVIPGAYHGFDFVARDTRVSKRFLAKQVDVLKRAFAVADR